MALQSSAANLIAGFEGFISEPAFDVNAFRTGFGSDTITTVQGNVIPVRQGLNVSREDAERDLNRRVGEFQAGVVGDIGQDAWNTMNADQRDVLTSIAYNYGSLPDRVTSVIASGGDIASAISSLRGDNEGINAARRDQEAQIFAGGVRVAQADTGTRTDATQPQAVPAGVWANFSAGNLTEEKQAAVQELIDAGIWTAPEPQQTEEQSIAKTDLLSAYMSGTLDPERGAVVQELLDAGVWTLPEAPEEEPRSFGEGVLRQLGLTVRAGAEGAAGFLGLASDPITGLINLALEDENQLPMLQQNVAGLLTAAGVPEPENTAERIAQTTAQLLVGGGAGVGAARAAGRAATGAVAKGVAGQMAAQPLAQVVGAGTSGAASQTTAELGGGEGAQLAAALLGGVVGAGVAPKGGARPTGLTPAQRAVREAEAQGIRPLTSDVRPPTTYAARWLQSTGEKLPVVGTGPVRAAQQTQRVAAIRNTLADFGADYSDDLSDSVVRNIVGDLSETRRTAVRTYTGMKAEVFANVADAGPVPMSNTVKTIDTELARLQSLGLEELTPAIRALKDWKNAIQGQGIDNVELLRKQLGESFKGGDLASTTGTTQKSINSIYTAVRDDIGSFIKDNGLPRDHTRWMVANRRLSDLMGELDNSALKATLAKADVTPETVERLLFSAKRSDVQTLYRNLSPAGRENARAAILHRAMVKAGPETSPVKFASEVNRLGAQTGIFFNEAQLGQVKGLTRALDLTRRASEAAMNPPTGQSLTIPVGAAVLTDLLGGMGAGLAAGATVGGAARFYESKPVRDALLALSRAKIGSAEEAQIMKRLIAAAQTFQQDEIK